MRLFIDTDVLLDVLLRREPYFKYSAAILDWAELHPGQAALSWHSLANLHYLSKDGAKPFIEDLLQFIEVPRTGTEHMKTALQLPFADLEDAMQTSAAILFKAQIIATRNTKDYRNSPIKAQTPKDLITSLTAIG
jgi:predicted nucleic acid-binding protein